MRVSSLLALVALSCTTPSVVDDDAGDAAFVVQVVPTLLGRRVSNHAELQTLVSVVQSEGRAALVDLLTYQDEYVEYWTQVIVDDLQVKRSGNQEQPASCFDDQLLGFSDQNLLATHVATAEFDDDFGQPWTMGDLIRGSIRTGQINAIYRGYLFVMSSFPGDLDADDTLARMTTGQDFLNVYLDRDAGCLGCHSASYSTVEDFGRPEDWDRHSPLPADLEGTVFTQTTSAGEVFYGGQFGERQQDALYNLFRADAHASECDPKGLAPWGMCRDCVDNTGGDSKYYGFKEETPGSGDEAAVPGGIVGDDVGVIELADALREGVSGFTLATGSVITRSGSVAAGKTVADGVDCASCHDGSTADELVDLLPYVSDGRVLEALQQDSGVMTLGLSYDDSLDVLAYLRTTTDFRYSLEYTGEMLDPLLHGEHGLAFMVAANFANHIAEEVGGGRLTVEHGQPRNSAQEEVLFELARAFTLDHSWSLDGLLEDIVLDASFNRVKPSTADNGSDPYPYPMVMNPWAAFDPRSTDAPVVGDDANGQGDMVHRWSVVSLYSQVSHAMGWPSIRAFNLGHNTHPLQSDIAALGRYESQNSQGFGDLSFQSYWVWEQLVGSGLKPKWVVVEDLEAPGTHIDDLQRIRSTWANNRWELANNGLDDDGDGCVDFDDVNGDNGAGSSSCDYEAFRIAVTGWDDWADLLVAEASAQDASMSRTVATLYDRLLSDGDYSVDADLVAAYLDAQLSSSSTDVLALTMNDYIDALPGGSASERETEARRVVHELAGVLMTSPQFMLAGLPVTEGWADPPEELLTVCVPGQLCTAEDFCDAYSTDLQLLGYSYDCRSDEVDLAIDITIAAPPALKIGGWEVPYTIRVANIGGYTSMSTELWWDDGGPTVMQTIEALSPGDSTELEVTVWVPKDVWSGLPIGVTTLSAYVDPLSTLNDQDWSNNFAELDIEAAYWKPDYRVEGLWYEPAGASHVDVHYSVVNRGPVGLHWTHSSITGARHMGVVVDRQTVDGLGVAESQEFVHHMPTSCFWQQRDMVADVDDDIVENDEANNSASMSYSNLCLNVDPDVFDDALRGLGIEFDFPGWAIEPPLYAPVIRVEPYVWYDAVNVLDEWILTGMFEMQTEGMFWEQIAIGSEFVVVERFPMSAWSQGAQGAWDDTMFVEPGMEPEFEPSLGLP